MIKPQMLNRHVLITGATGFLGGAIVAELLQNEQGPNMSFFVRAKDKIEGLSRLLENLAKFGVSECKLGSLSPGQVICGDFEYLDNLETSSRLPAVTHVINCAALATFSNSPKIWPVNVDGTFAFASLVNRRAKLERFVQVGTAMSCGPDVVSPVAESWESRPDAEDHLVPYTASKLAIEEKLRAELPDLPLVVARPSIIVGHTALGCAPSGSIFWVFRMAHALKQFTCDLNECIDVVPVDYCAHVIIALTFKPELSHDLYHVSSADDSCRFDEIDVAYAHAAGLAPMGANYRKIAIEDLAGLAGQCEEQLGIINRRLLVRALKLYGAFAELDFVFDNRRLLAEGLLAPKRLVDYIGLCVRTSAEIGIQEQMAFDFK
jgi:nucleoside-diphosphate-sugar epimerase